MEIFPSKRGEDDQEGEKGVRRENSPQSRSKQVIESRRKSGYLIRIDGDHEKKGGRYPGSEPEICSVYFEQGCSAFGEVRSGSGPCFSTCRVDRDLRFDV